MFWRQGSALSLLLLPLTKYPQCTSWCIFWLLNQNRDFKTSVFYTARWIETAVSKCLISEGDRGLPHVLLETLERHLSVVTSIDFRNSTLWNETCDNKSQRCDCASCLIDKKCSSHEDTNHVEDGRLLACQPRSLVETCRHFTPVAPLKLWLLST